MIPSWQRGGLLGGFFMDEDRATRLARNPFVTPPQSDTYEEWLRYLVQSAEHDAPELMFLAGLWTYAHNKGGLTERQRKHLAPYMRQAEEWLAALDNEKEKYIHTDNVVPFNREEE